VVTIVPPLPTCHSDIVHEAFIALVQFVQVFTALSPSDTFCASIGNELNEKGREKILFSLLCVPSPRVQEAVMACIRCVSLEELDEEEIAFLVQMLEGGGGAGGTGTGTGTQSLLSAVLSQLQNLAESEKTKAGTIFRQLFVEQATQSCFSILSSTLASMAYTTTDQQSKDGLAFACLNYLMAISRQTSLRQYYTPASDCNSVDS
jgi:hypothetical protein